MEVGFSTKASVSSTVLSFRRSSVLGVVVSIFDFSFPTSIWIRVVMGPKPFNATILCVGLTLVPPILETLCRSLMSPVTGVTVVMMEFGSLLREVRS